MVLHILFIIFINICDVQIHCPNKLWYILCVSLISRSWSWNCVMFRNISRHFRMSNLFFIPVFIHFRMSTYVYIQIFRSTTGAFRKYLRLSNFFLMLIRNSRCCYGYIHCSNICSSCITVFLNNYLLFKIFSIFVNKEGQNLLLLNTLF